MPNTLSLTQYIQDHYCKTLHELAKVASPSGVILELGVGSWGSGVWICSGAAEGTNCPVYGIDNFSMEGTSVLQVLDSMKDRGYSENLLVMSTYNAHRIWNCPISLLFIDADHSYEACYNDFQWFYPSVIHDGFIVFHDSEQQEVKRVIKEVSEFLCDDVEMLDADGRGCYFAKKK